MIARMLLVGLLCSAVALGQVIESKPARAHITEQLAQREDGHTWMERGDLLREQGRLEEARQCYQRARALLPANVDVLKKIERLEMERFDSATRRFDATREKALLNVAEQWSEPSAATHRLRKEIRLKGSERSRAPAILQKMETIRIPCLKFESAEVTEVLRYLSQKSREWDPAGEGVNFVIRLNPNTENPMTVSFSMKDVSLLSALDLIKKMTGLHYEVEEYAVVISAGDETGGDFVVRRFAVSPDFFQPDEDVQTQLESKGVVFAEGATASFFPNTSQLVVRGPRGMMTFLENLLALERRALPQVQIETRFVEFSEDKLEELRFRWQLGATAEIPAVGALVAPGKTGVSGQTAGIRGIRRDALTPQEGIAVHTLDRILGGGLSQPSTFEIGGIVDGHGLRLLVDLMQRVAGGNLMSAPKITLQKGKRGAVRIAREFVYPRKYSSPTLSSTKYESVVLPPNPEDFNFDEPRNIGVQLYVKVADVNTDTRLIDLKLENMEVLEFDGFIDYGNQVVTFTEDGNTNLLSMGTALQPVFSSRRARTQIQLRDGQTLVMGGFIRDDFQQLRDRVPILSDVPLFGRLFRGESEQSVKRNLVILSTARLVGADGQPLALSEEGEQP